MTLRYPLGFPLAFETISNKETSEMEANASPLKPKFLLAACSSVKSSNFDVAAYTYIPQIKEDANTNLME